MNDPSQGVQRELLPHVHLLSTYRFPQLPHIHPEKVSEWLQNAPKISRDQAPFYWTYLDRPQDMTILLVWQSMSLGHEFPSDGYIWTPQESAFQIQIEGGYTLEMYQQKTGYAPGEPVATHSRRRYRLLPSRIHGVQGPQPDPCLWIVHYASAEPNDRIPSNAIPIDIRVQQTMSTRAYLHSQGQIVQKEFMLHDRTNWPSIAFPRNNRPQALSIYGQTAPPARIPQAMAYPPQHPPIGPPAKRVRTQAGNSQSAAAASSAIAALDADDEEDTSRGDWFDHTTPREISMTRFKQNHEWMEEVLSSVYSIHQIVPTDLGLGVRGELSGLTDGIFDAPLDPDKDVAKYNYIGRLDPEKAEQFRTRVNEQIAQTQLEMEKMKAKHAKRLAKLQRGNMLRLAEKELRLAVDDPSDTGPEYWRLEGRIDTEEEESVEVKAPPVRPPPKVADITAQVEASIGRHVSVIQELIRIHDGGYEEAPEVPTPQAVASPPLVAQNGSRDGGVLVGDTDMDMTNSAVGLLDQYHSGLPSNNTSIAQQTYLQARSHTGIQNMHTPSQHPVLPHTHHSSNGSAQPAQPLHTQASQPDSVGGGDWVVIPPGGISPTPREVPAPTPSTQPPASTSPMHLNTATASSNTLGLPNFQTSPNDFVVLGDLDTAGDALASYGPGEGLDDLSMDIDMDIGAEMDEALGADQSAFGDAFHGHDAAHNSDGDGDRQAANL